MRDSSRDPESKRGADITRDSDHSTAPTSATVKPDQLPQLPVVRVRSDQISSSVALSWHYEFSLE